MSFVYNDLLGYRHGFVNYVGDVAGSQTGEVEQSFGASQAVTDADADDHSVTVVLS